MGFIKFWIFSTLFFFTFPFSLILCLLFLGNRETKQFIAVLVKDYVQTILIIFVLFIVIITFLVNYITSLFQ
jgi:hypothetical protein